MFQTDDRFKEAAVECRKALGELKRAINALEELRAENERLEKEVRAQANGIILLNRKIDGLQAAPQKLTTTKEVYGLFMEVFNKWHDDLERHISSRPTLLIEHTESPLECFGRLIRSRLQVIDAKPEPDLCPICGGDDEYQSALQKSYEEGLAAEDHGNEERPEPPADLMALVDKYENVHLTMFEVYDMPNDTTKEKERLAESRRCIIDDFNNLRNFIREHGVAAPAFEAKPASGVSKEWMLGLVDRFIKAKSDKANSLPEKDNYHFKYAAKSFETMKEFINVADFPEPPVTYGASKERVLELVEEALSIWREKEYDPLWYVLMAEVIRAADFPEPPPELSMDAVLEKVKKAHALSVENNERRGPLDALYLNTCTFIKKLEPTKKGESE